MAVAAASDVAVVVVGDTSKEGADRSTMTLPAGQDALIARIAAANPRTVVVLDTAGGNEILGTPTGYGANGPNVPRLACRLVNIKD